MLRDFTGRRSSGRGKSRTPSRRSPPALGVRCLFCSGGNTGSSDPALHPADHVLLCKTVGGWGLARFGQDEYDKGVLI